MLEFSLGTVWILLSAALVFIMHLGFAAVESGLTQSKNTVNILFKNVIVLSVGLLAYAAIGFNLMYPGAEFAGQMFGFAGFGIGTDAAGITTAYNANYTYWADFIFQAMFAATAATIVSGAVAERMKIEIFLLFSLILVGLIYPIVGMWKWGGGFLDTLGFYDFAGSTLVHGVGGWAALAGALLVGPRLGKYINGKSVTILPHSMPLATVGVFLLWFGWFGFNGGSVLSADPGAISLVFVTTALAGAAGIFGATIISKIILGTYDLSMALNGALAGLVGITAGADLMSPGAAILIGGIAGALVVGAVLFLDKCKIDDPVGAISVHLICGIWGTLAVGIFGSKAGLGQLGTQALGVLIIGVFTFGSSYGILQILKRLIGVRIGRKAENTGLDLTEHGLSAYRGMYLEDQEKETGVRIQENTEDINRVGAKR